MLVILNENLSLATAAVQQTLLKKLVAKVGIGHQGEIYLLESQAYRGEALLYILRIIEQLKES